MDIKVIVATPKRYRMPQDNMYLPLHVGRALAEQDFGWQGDDTGDNISLKNPYYCELTGLYWAWKNLQADSIGLVHYRRFFRGGNGLFLTGGADKRWNSILTYTEADKLLSKYPIILPKKRCYYIETIKSHYEHAHNKDHLYKVREVIKKHHIDYIEAFDNHMDERSGHMFNMFIMKFNYFSLYCQWLFDILFRLENELSEKRILGFIGERLLDVWIKKNMYNYIELDVNYMEEQHLLNKYKNFIIRKFIN